MRAAAQRFDPRMFAAGVVVVEHISRGRRGLDDSTVLSDRVLTYAVQDPVVFVTAGRIWASGSGREVRSSLCSRLVSFPIRASGRFRVAAGIERRLVGYRVHDHAIR